MNFIHEYDDIIKLPKNNFIKGKHPDKCPDCNEEPSVVDLNMPFTYDELWVAACKCGHKVATGDTIPAVVKNWDTLIKHVKEQQNVK